MTEQKKGSYKYFVDLGDRMELVNSKTRYVDEVCCLSVTLLNTVIPNLYSGYGNRDGQVQDRLWDVRRCDHSR